MNPLKSPDKNQDHPLKLPAVRETSISVWLDNFDDIFSDFDPRSYSERTISDDFMNELRKRAAENNHSIAEIHLLLPAKERRSEYENLISKRIHQIIKVELQQQINILKKLRKMGLLFSVIGLVLMILTIYSGRYIGNEWTKKIIYALTEPSGWFFTWNGLDKLFSSSEKKIPELIFFRKISKSKVNFNTV
jgi:hypothetical protein